MVSDTSCRTPRVSFFVGAADDLKVVIVSSASVSPHLVRFDLGWKT